MDTHKKYLHYGDIIRIISPTNSFLHEEDFFIMYIDTKNIKLINLEKKTVTLLLNEDGSMEDKKIIGIHVLSSASSTKNGYAIQNQLISNTWIDIIFDFDFEFKLTGLITKVEEDRIEISLWHESEKQIKDIIYLDFAYKGLCKKFHIKQIFRRESPDSFYLLQKENQDIGKEKEENTNKQDEKEEEEEEDDFLEDTSIIFFTLEDLQEKEKEKEKEKKYERLSLDVQIDCIGNTLSNSNDFYQLERYIQLRNLFSIQDENNFITGYFLYSENEKPLINKIKRFSSPLWILPIVSCERKIYSSKDEILLQENNIDSIDFFQNIRNQESMRKKFEMNDTLKHKYHSILKENNKPFLKSKNKVLQENTPILHDFEGILPNTEMVISYNNIQRYIQKDIEIDIDSILFLPDIVTFFSKITLPTLDILTRASWNENYLMKFEMLPTKIKTKTKTKIQIKTKIIDTFEKLCYHRHKNPIQYIIDKNSIIQEDKDKYHKLLQIILPTIQDILLQPSLSLNYCIKNFSFFEIIRHVLEPYHLTTRHISFNSTYALIKKTIDIFITHYLEKMKKKQNQCKRKYFQWNKKIPLSIDKNSIDEIMKTTEEFDDIYQQSFISIYSSERLSSLYRLDQCNIYFTLLFSKNFHLLVNPSYVDSVVSNKIDFTKKILAKKYLSLKDLEKDNNRSNLFYDEEYDNSPYFLLDTEEPWTKLSLEKKLVEDHYYSKQLAEEMTKTLFLGKKMIQSNEYALLERENGQNKQYYKRIKDQWIHDENVKEESFLHNDILYQQIQKNRGNYDKKGNLRKISRNYNALTPHKNIYAIEFKTRLDEIDLLLKKKNEQTLEKQISYCHRWNILKTIQLQKQNNVTLQIGNHVLVDIFIKSPHLSLRNNILSHENFAQKQRYIIDFVEKFTRFFILGDEQDNKDKEKDKEKEKEKDKGKEKNKRIENQFWFYCIESNTPLLPTFYYQLAKSFYNNTYINTLHDICHERGKIDNYGSYIDIHSGYPISLIFDFSKRKKSLIYPKKNHVSLSFKYHHHKDIKLIHTILDVISDQLYVKTEMIPLYDYIVQSTIEMMEKTIETKELYQEKLVYLKKKNQTIKQLSYEEFKNLNLIYLITTFLFISLQTLLPPLVCVDKKKCSFLGYPMKNQDQDQYQDQDHSGIEYISRVVLNLKNNTVPWNSLFHTDKIMFVTNLTKKIDILLERKDIQLLYKKKEKYNQLSINSLSTTVLDPHDIKKFIYMLPPVISYSIVEKLNHVTEDLHNDFIKSIIQGTKQQRQYIGIYQTKLIMYGYGIMEIINQIVARKDKEKKFFPSLSFLEQFMKESESLIHYIETSWKYELVLLNVKELNTPPLLKQYSIKDEILINKSKFGRKDETEENKGNEEKEIIIISNNVTTFSDKNMYKTFIYYLQLDFPGPIPKHFQTVIVDKPKLYDSRLTLNEKIEILQKEKNIYNRQNFQALLKIIPLPYNLLKNEIKSNHEKEEEKKQQEEDENKDLSFDNFQHYIKIKFHRIHQETETEIKSDIIIKKDSTFFFDKMMNLLFISESSDNIHLPLQEINTQLFSETNNLIYYFTTTHDHKYWKENIFNMSSWNQWKIYKDNKEIAIATITNHIRNSLYNMINTYPLLVIKKNSQNKLFNPDLIPLYNLFYNENKTIQNIFSSIDQSNLQRILCFLEIIPLHLYDTLIIEELYRFCWGLFFLTFLEQKEEGKEGKEGKEEKEEKEEKKNIKIEIEKKEEWNHDVLKKKVETLFLFLQIESNHRILIDVIF